MARGRAWADTMVSSIFAIAGTQSLTDLLFSLSDKETSTVVRIVAHLGLTLDVIAESFDGVVICDLAIGVAAEEAFVAGVVPDPD